MTKEFNSLKDFLEDASFNRWVMEQQEADRLIWEAWLQRHPEKKGLVKEATRLLKGIPFNPQYPTEEKVTEQLQLLHQTIAAKEVAFKQPQKRLGRRRNLLLATAAAIALLLTISFLIPSFLNPLAVQHLTAFGQIEKIQLPDGSSVSLNANSSLTYRRNNPRKIWLDGEAFFEVTKKEDKSAFQVITKDLTVKVLGTSFNVNSRNDQTKVFLEEGKVVLEMEEQLRKELKMAPGDLVKYSKTEQTVEKRKAQALENTSWKNGVIRYKDTPLTEVLTEMSSIYGIQFDVKDANLKEQFFSGGIPVLDLAIALKTLEEVYGIKVKQNNGRYILE